MRRTDRSRGLVRQVVGGAGGDMGRNRMSKLDPFLPQLETAWTDGSGNGAALCRALKTGGLRVVTEWAIRRRKVIALAGEHPETLDNPVSRWSQTELGQQSEAHGVIKTTTY